MKSPFLCGVALILLAAALLVACGTPPSPAPTGEPPTTTPAAETPPTVEVITVVVPIPGVVEPENIVLQLDWTGGMLAPFVWGDLPELTLLDDGTLIYQDKQAMTVQLTQQEAQALVQKVLDLGFERLESYTDECQTAIDGTGSCITDATTSRLRLRMPDGKLHEVDNYAEFTNDPEALKAIRAYLTDYRNPAARPYSPEKAVLYVRTIGNPGDLKVVEWPLDPALLSISIEKERYCAFVIGRSDAEMLAALPRQSMGYQYFRLGDQVWEAVLIPWLPGADDTATLAYDGLLCPGPSPKE
jgi:hypothetical protein